tara:strand:+ start:202117 stop:203454 length:1338 start_codon:yes stop_codon:yes gene_type:complete
VNEILLLNGILVNEGRVFESDLLIRGDRIERIDPDLSHIPVNKVIDLNGSYVLPGLIDDQVHLREPGMTHKGTILSESQAAICGGVTSFLEMPNTSPPTITLKAIEDKKNRANGNSFANYGFYLGATNDNLEDIKNISKNDACGIKVFMGASTGNMLVDDHEALENIFRYSPLIIATHCEDSPTIWKNEKIFKERYTSNLSIEHHPSIRSEEACFKSSSLAVGLAKKYDSRLHVLHLSTKKELGLFSKGDLIDKKITAEACVHHLWFDESDYASLGNKIKCNPSIKSIIDKKALINAVNEDIIDIIATDHAPHTLEEKKQPYLLAPSGLPLVQHSLLMLLQYYHQGLFSLEKIVSKACHNPARLFSIKERGFLREGFYADIVVADLSKKHDISKENLRYKCGWSPLEGLSMSSSVIMTVLNGKIVSQNGKILGTAEGRELEFNYD